MPVINYDQSYPEDLLAMMPAGFNEPDSIEEVPVEFGTEGAFDPDDINKKDLWQQWLIQLKDIPKPWFENAGKALVVRRDGKPSAEGYTIEFAYLEKLETARDFTISGDGTAAAVQFDGQANVDLVLSDVSATRLKNARDFAISGAVTAAAVSFDATGNITLATSYNEVVPDDKLPSWIAQNFNNIDTAIANINTTLGTLATEVQVQVAGAGHVLNAGNINNYVRVPGSGNVVVPNGLCQVNDVIYIHQYGGAASSVAVVGGAGVSIQAPYGQNTTLRGAGATVALVCVGSNAYELIGQTNFI